MPTVATRAVLLTDIEGSTALLQRVGPRFAELLGRHHKIVRDAVAAYDGREESDNGDGFKFLFPSVAPAIGAALEAQLGLVAERWPEDGAIRVRMGMHVGEVTETPAGLVGMALHEAARIGDTGHGGQVVASEAVHSVAGRLPDRAGWRTLGEHRLRDIGPVVLYQLTHPELPSEFPPLRAERGARHNLPSPRTSLIGRDVEATLVEKMLDEHRLVTLAGAGGCGKTRLALRAAADWLSRRTSDVWFADLSVLSGDELVASTVARTITPGYALDELSSAADTIRTRATLLVLDSCEHVLAGCAHVVDVLLERCSELRVLCTSREPIGMEAEAVFRVPSLAVPSIDDPLVEVRAADSVRLFEVRAGLVRHGYTVTVDDAHAVAEICRQLDGMPLAIELAAARVRVLQPIEIVARLDDVFSLLTENRPGSLPRHRTLQATIEWSYTLLSPQEQEVFRRLCVFRGGAGLDAIGRVCGDDIAPSIVLDLVTSLLDKSLVIVAPSEIGPRVGMYETLRQFALAQLVEIEGGSERTRERHATWFSGLADRLLDGPEAGGMGPWIHAYHVEAENFREAAQWACRHGDDRALRIAASCTLGWEHTGYPSHGSGMLDDALEASSSAPAWLVTVARWGVIRSPGMNGVDDPEADFRRLDEAAAEAGDPFSAALAAWAHACEAPFAFNVPPDEMRFADVVAMVDRCGRPLYQVMVRLDLGSISSPKLSRPMLSEAMDLTRSHGLSEMVGLCDLGIAKVCAYSGESAAAVAAAHRCLRAVSSLPPGDRENYQAICAWTEAEHGDLELARALLEDASLATSGPVGTFKVRSTLAHVYRLLGLVEDCRSTAARALEGHDTRGTDFFDELLFLTLAALDCHDGRPLGAARRLADRWRVGRRWSGLSDHPQRFMEELAGCAKAAGREQDTVDLLATVAARRSEEGKPVAPNRRTIVEMLTSEARGHALDDQAVQAVADALARGVASADG